MAAKYQVLTNIHGGSSVIEQIENKDQWKVLVPDAGGMNTAKTLARLLNEEHTKMLTRQQAREADGIV